MPDVVMKEIKEFKCPQCGDFRYGTSNATGNFSEWVGNCNNPECRFTWPRTEDHKYFVGTGRYEPAEEAGEAVGPTPELEN